MTTPYNITFESKNFDINGKLNVENEISTDSDAKISGDLEVGGTTVLDGNVECKGDLIITEEGQTINVRDQLNAILETLNALEGRLTTLESNLGF